MKSGATTLSSLEALVLGGSAGSWGHFVDVQETENRDEMPSVAIDHSSLRRSRTSSGRLGLSCSHHRHSSANLSMLWTEESKQERAEEELNHDHQHEQEEAVSHGFVFGVSSLASPTSECSIWSMDSYSESENEEDEDFDEIDEEDAWDCLSSEEEEEEEEEEESLKFESKYESVERDLAHFNTTNNSKSLLAAAEELVVEEMEMKESLSFTVSQGITFSFS